MTRSILSKSQITWQHAPYSFSLVSNDEEVLRHGTEVLSYWNFQDPPISSAVARNFTISVEKTERGYLFHPTQMPLPEVDGPFPVKAPTGTPAPRLYPDTANVIRAAETDSAIAIFNHPEDFLTVHGALLARGDDAVLIVGPSQSGKSTTSCALWAAGWQLLADDVTILDPAAGRAAPLMRRVSLRHPSRDLLGDDFWQRMTTAKTCDPTTEGYIFHPDEIEGRSRARSVRLRAIVFLRRLGAPAMEEAQAGLVAPVQALLSLSPYTNIVRHLGLGEAMKRLSPLINSIPSYDLCRGPLPLMIEKLNRLVPAEAPLASVR